MEKKPEKPVSKDIRSFFGGRGGGGAAPKRPAPAKADSGEVQEAKRSKVVKASPAPKKPVRSPAKPPAGKKATPRKAAAPQSSGKRKKDAIKSESDDDFEVDLSGEAESEDVSVQILSSDEEEVTPAAKKAKPSTPAAKKAKQAVPAKAKTSRPASGGLKSTPTGPKKAAQLRASNHVEAAVTQVASIKRELPSMLSGSPVNAPAGGSQPPAPAPAPPPSAKRAKKKEKEELPDDVAAAVAAVDAAVKALPEIVPTVVDESATFGAGGDSRVPPHLGEKEQPVGHPECLLGKTFVITGGLDSMYRGDAENLIKRHSGRITSAVSGKTTFLLCGEGAGKRKVAVAEEKGVRYIDEDGLFSLICAAPAPDESEPAAPPAPKPAPVISTAGRVGGAGPSSSASAAPVESQLWVAKHRPRTSAELVGNNSLVDTLREWLRNWEAIHLRGAAVPEGKKGPGGRQKDLGKRAVLLSGPPGIGKTSAAMIVTRELGFQPIEVNASDTRGKSDTSVLKGIAGKLANSIKELATNAALGTAADGSRKRVCLIMDEVDGMSGGDRGGTTELINTIKTAKCPIICICNDKYNQKLKSLKNHTLELDFRKPLKNQITKRMAAVCAAEGLTVNAATLDALVEAANQDLRLVLGQLQMIRLRASRLSFDQVKAGNAGTGKDADMSPFEAARRLLDAGGGRMSLNDQSDLVFQDLDFVPLLLQENYLNHRSALASNEDMRMKVVAKAADAFSCGDVVNRSVRAHQNWHLMPFAAMLGGVYPATYMRGPRETFGLYPGEQNFPRFSAWFGNNSSSGKQRRLLGELHTRLASSGLVSSDRTGVRTAYLPMLRQELTQPLVQLEKEGIPQVIGTMQEYCMAREDLDFVLDVTKFKTRQPWGEDPYKAVPTQVKSAFTRMYNAAREKPRCNIAVDDFKRKRGKRGGGAPAEPLLGVEGDPEIEGVPAPADGSDDEEDGEEEEAPGPLKAAEAEKRARLLARRGIAFEANAPPAKGKRGGGAARGGRGGAKAGSSRARKK